MVHGTADIAIVGSGIVGLAHAYMALRRGYRVVLFEREQFPVGASIRNFGLIWPIGQEPGKNLDHALRSRQHWLEVARETGIWLNQNGSLHLAYHDDELAVLDEFESRFGNLGYDCTLISAEKAASCSGVVNKDGLKGALHSSTELTVNPREAIRRISEWLQQELNLVTRYGSVVTAIDFPRVYTPTETWIADKVIICNGADFETLYPHVFNEKFTKCKLQMMKAVTDHTFSIGPTLCAGLTLTHYKAFSQCGSLDRVMERFDREDIRYSENGIHVLLSQNNYGELIIGDTHHYGRTFEPFDSEALNDLVLEYLRSFTRLSRLRITERWNGVYPKVEGEAFLHLTPEPGVSVITGLGGAGMTLSFGIAEETIQRL